MKVCVLGLGTVGIPTALYLHEHHLETFGYDVVEKSVKGVKTYSEWKKVPHADIYVVTVSSNSVESVCEQIAGKDKTRLVAIESTVKVGTCRKISNDLGLRNLVHCPHRYWAEAPKDHGVRQLRVIGAVNKKSLDNGLRFYKTLEIPLHVCPTIEVAEMCKIAENAYRFVHIAFAEELKLICDTNDIFFEEVRKACNTKWNTEIPEAREGILGACLPKDTGYLKSLADCTPLIDGAILTDQVYQEKAKKTK